MSYQLTKSSIYVRRVSDGAFVPSDRAEVQEWLAANNTLLPGDQPTVLEQITALEATATPRRMREAVLGIDGGWLAALNSQIAALRAQL